MHVTYLEANPIKQILIIRYVWEFFRNFAARGQEHAIRHFPDQIKSATKKSWGVRRRCTLYLLCGRQ
jgi:hypothetical protein